jgi:hypothetical protein
LHFAIALDVFSLIDRSCARLSLHAAPHADQDAARPRPLTAPRRGMVAIPEYSNPPAIPVELSEALDRLMEALNEAVASGHPADSVSAPVRECATVARATAVKPETLIAALKPRLADAVTRVGPERADDYLRALVSMAIAGYFADEASP